ncbi:hypothetical protein [Ruminiclostridium papyrosolvens]|uniref:Uncharacterized protein n=1 Tax=Ruminiclostridium papyrosolvens C7 TaxID=1330534 RepID=U4R0K2_9FIRM|nr:hypothetical protein [Ruminiclostridium papyrosolvens]EPR11639.1 hypothetical protein L323_11570 [Ruminiclostridium papyrosolvens C7]
MKFSTMSTALLAINFINCAGCPSITTFDLMLPAISLSLPFTLPKKLPTASFGFPAP